MNTGQPISSATFSRYLRPLRQDADPALAGRLTRRWAAALALAGAAGGLAHGTRAGWFDPDGPGRIAYWLHDHVYLPLKGNLWTAWFPEALIPWTAVLVLLAVWLAGSLSGRPLLRMAHAAVTRRAILLPAGRRMLDRWHAATVNGPFRPRHLEAMAERMRAAMLDDLDAAGGPAVPYATRVERLCVLTVLSVSWRLRGDAGEKTRTGAAADLLETALRIEGAAGAGDGHAVRAATGRLAADLEACLADLAAAPAEDVFAIPALARDAMVLTGALGTRRTSGRRADPARLRPVAAAVMERCNRLNAIRSAGERGLRGQGPDITVPAATAPASGRLAVLIALAVAQEAAEPDLARAMLDAMSGLDFARRAGVPAPALGFAGLWLAEAPDLPHWRLAARLVGAAPSAGPTGGDLMPSADMTYLDEPMHRLAWIAGAPETTP